MLSFECIKNEKSVYFLLTSAVLDIDMDLLAAEYNQYNHNGKYYAKWAWEHRDL